MSEREPTPGEADAVLAVSSEVARGSVGLRAAGFALERLGNPVWQVPTIWLPWHPGQGPAPRIVPDDGAFSDALEAMVASPRIREVAAVLTGYFASAAQISAVCRAVDAIRRFWPASTATF